MDEKKEGEPFVRWGIADPILNKADKGGKHHRRRLAAPEGFEGRGNATDAVPIRWDGGAEPYGLVPAVVGAK